MSDFKHIYAHQAENYERLVAREDYQGNILNALEEIRPFSQQRIVEFGAGTGRLTYLLAPIVRQIQAFDQSAAMLKVAKQKLSATPYTNWHLEIGDHTQIPLPDHCTDIAIEGWSFAHYRGWFPNGWQTKLDEAIAEMRRLLTTDGTMILLETLGTGYKSPHRHPGLDELYEHLENKHGFQHKWIRTDYQFNSIEEATELTQFFFGDDLAEQVINNHWVVLPECTGIWWKNQD